MVFLPLQFHQILLQVFCVAAGCTSYHPAKPYIGPYKVLEPGSKFFKFDMGGRPEIISIDQLKPTHLDIDCLVQVAVPL